MLLMIFAYLFVIGAGVAGYKVTKAVVERHHRKELDRRTKERQRFLDSEIAKKKIPSKPGITIIPATRPPKDPTSHFG